jgi:hypothetical protein
MKKNKSGGSIINPIQKFMNTFNSLHMKPLIEEPNVVVHGLSLAELDGKHIYLPQIETSKLAMIT